MRVQSKENMMQELTTMLRELFAQRRDGVAISRLARSHGYVDGYMRVMLDAGVATKSELLNVVAAERAKSDGPATRVDAGTSAVA